MESSSAAFPGTLSTVSFSSTEHHRWIFMFAAESPFNIVSRVGQDKIHVEGMAGSAFGSEKENVSRQLNSSSQQNHSRNQGRSGQGADGGPTSGENDLRVELTIEKPATPSPHTAAQGQGQGAKEEQGSPDSSSSSESPKSTDSDDSNGMMSP
ncbi:hypothetical protein K457DRAFT_21821 [Linnemannia elongata AG-77]|uniref:Uncharacterized protein n=1 Tax=Linnemannia elongata AG-77 TaxID=1314771 RepID=A0A197JQT5_9FUNG|nr:hypothetical protein K457DRAFT_21821 [Linnemannia elongata AG-77]